MRSGWDCPLLERTRPATLAACLAATNSIVDRSHEELYSACELLSVDRLRAFDVIAGLVDSVLRLAGRDHSLLNRLARQIQEFPKECL